VLSSNLEEDFCKCGLFSKQRDENALSKQIDEDVVSVTSSDDTNSNTDSDFYARECDSDTGSSCSDTSSTYLETEENLMLVITESSSPDNNFAFEQTKPLITTKTTTNQENRMNANQVRNHYRNTTKFP